MVISCAVCLWYFEEEKSRLHNPVMRGYFYTCWFHWGTMSCGSLFNVWIKGFRFFCFACKKVIVFFDKETYETLWAKCAGFFYKVICILACYEHIKFFTKSAYLNTGLFSENYCDSSRRSFFYYLRADSKVLKLRYLATFALYPVQFMVAFSGAVFVLYFLQYSPETFLREPTQSVTYLLGPTLFTLLGTFYVGGIFSGLFQACINSVLFCYMVDEEMYQREQIHATQEMYDFMNIIVDTEIIKTN